VAAGPPMLKGAGNSFLAWGSTACWAARIRFACGGVPARRSSVPEDARTCRDSKAKNSLPPIAVEKNNTPKTTNQKKKKKKKKKRRMRRPPRITDELSSPLVHGQRPSGGELRGAPRRKTVRRARTSRRNGTGDGGSRRTRVGRTARARHILRPAGAHPSDKLRKKKGKDVLF